jgi:AcrR family transcriptional regulator
MPDSRRDLRREAHGGARRTNRGPSAAAENRAALIAAARQVFATDGFEAPLASVTRAARVGQGSLYRHFPDRISLALAVFEDGIRDLEALSERPGTTLDDMLALITEQTITSTAFVEMVNADTADARVLQIRDRVAGLLDTHLSAARAAGQVRPEITANDLMLAIGMLAGVLGKTPPPDRPRTAKAAWRLLRTGIAT